MLLVPNYSQYCLPLFVATNRSGRKSASKSSIRRRSKKRGRRSRNTNACLPRRSSSSSALRTLTAETAATRAPRRVAEVAPYLYINCSVTSGALRGQWLFYFRSCLVTSIVRIFLCSTRKQQTPQFYLILFLAMSRPHIRECNSLHNFYFFLL